VTHAKISYEQLVALAYSFEVSAEAFVHRLADIGIIDRELAKATLQTSEFEWARSEVVRPLLRSQIESATWYPERYLKLATRAYQSGIIGKSIVAKYLEVTLRSRPWILGSLVGAKPRIVLLDAGAVIHAHRSGGWAVVCSHYEVVVSAITLSRATPTGIGGWQPTAYVPV